MNNQIAPIVIKHGADIRYKNFSGVQTRYNKNGTPQFALFLDPELVDIPALIEEGWNVRQKEFDESDKPTEYYINVDITFNYRLKPEIRSIINSTNGEPPHGAILDEETICDLDDTIFTDAAIVVRPRVWTDDDGVQRVKAYLQELVVWSDPAYFADLLEGVIFD